MEARAARVNISVRLSQAGIDAVQELADAEQRTWSEMLRIVLAEGITARNKAAIRNREQR